MSKFLQYVVSDSRRTGRGWIGPDDLMGTPVRCFLDGRELARVVRVNPLRGIAEICVVDGHGRILLDKRRKNIRTRRLRGRIELVAS